MAIYLIPNGPMQTLLTMTPAATGTGYRTMLQVKPGASIMARIIEWGCSFDGFVAASPGQVELVETDVGATVTAHAANGITKIDAPALVGGDPTVSLIEVGTTATGYMATASEGSISTVRNLAGPQLIAPTNQFIQQFALGREPVIQAGKFARIRVHFTGTVNCYCYMVVEI